MEGVMGSSVNRSSHDLIFDYSKKPKYKIKVRKVWEPKDLWKVELPKLSLASQELINKIPTLHVTVLEKCTSQDKKFEFPRYEPVALDKNYSLINDASPRWDTQKGAHTLVFPMGYGLNQWKLPCATFCWLVTADGADVPILSNVERKYGNLWQQESFVLFKELVVRYSAAFLGFSFKVSYGNPTIVELYCCGTLIASTEQSEKGYFLSTDLYGLCLICLDLDAKINFFYARSQLNEMTNLISSLRSKLIITQDRRDSMLALFQRFGCWSDEFFKEAITRFDETKQISRNKRFGEFRKFLEEKYKEAQQQFISKKY